MAYQVLARKWRPRSFSEVVGQMQVVKALTHSLEQNRLHHAYLFTGTRGVGKTSLARLFAKCLNCETALSATPCNTCKNCVAIEEGRFLDLLEIDAASRTKVEDTRDLMDNVQYAPVQGRYKVYLIDEVHMLSNHSFNALLKTLEEPPAHVIFLLATTDPQRLPATVLSRCLQFHLKNFSEDQIQTQLAHVLSLEKMEYETGALRQLAQAAQGSMRDALSLLDQAIAHGAGHLKLEEVRELLGSTEPELLLALLNGLVIGNAADILNHINALAETGVDFQNALEELLSLLHRITVEQLIPNHMEATQDQEASQIAGLAKGLTAEAVQLYYQIALVGKRDLPLAPTPRTGFEMVLWRMLAFSPRTSVVENFWQPVGSDKNTSYRPSEVPSPKPSLAPKKIEQFKPSPASNNEPQIKETKTLIKVREDIQKVSQPTLSASSPIEGTNDWHTLLPTLNLHGPAWMIASHCVLTQKTPESIRLTLDVSHAILLNKSIEQQIKTALENYFQKSLNLTFDVGKLENETPAKREEIQQKNAHLEAVNALSNDKNLQTLLNIFDGKVVPESIKTTKQ